MTRKLIINLHRVAAEPEAVAGPQCPYTVSTACLSGLLAAIAQWRARGIEIGLTFDDGHISDYEIALPLLRRSGLAAEFFVLAGRIGQPGYLSAGQIRELAAAGMGIGSHGYDHLDWRQLGAAGLRREICDARALIEDVTGRRIDKVAIPFGLFDRRVIAALVEAGYCEIHTSSGGFVFPGRRLLPRNSLTVGFDPEVDIARLGGWPNHARSLARDRYWRLRFGASALLAPADAQASGRATIAGA